ncbi:virulence factor MviN [Ralstonia pickettii]|uniref:Virulence factor MviN n=1 Tax=Ralstonia pickettii TaxID=329 RepID=A0A7X2HLE6_RALPI|nr:lipid II flippase MurJ [Ralstonia pickettii]MRS98700.1 virulence factor MviN [Ralstonia pickettii]
MAITALNTGTLFAYQWFVVTQLGAGPGTDALFAGMVMPQLVLNVISGSLGYVLVPMLSVVDGRARSSTTWGFAIALALIFGGLATALWLLAPWWVPLSVPGFDAATIQQTVTLTRIQLVGMLFAGLGAPFNAAYQAQHRFIYPAVMALLAGLVALAFVVVLLGRGGVETAAWGLTLRAALQFLFQVRIGFPFVFPNFRDKEFADALRKLKPLIAGTVYYKTDQLLDRFLASMTPSGSLSLLHLAQQIYAAGNLVLANAIAIPLTPRLAKYAKDQDWAIFRREVMRALYILGGLGLLAFILIVFPGRIILQLFFAHGNLKAEAVNKLWEIMLALGMVWISGLTGQVLSTSFYAMSDTKTPTKVGVIGFTLGIGLKIAGLFLGGVIGIAIGSGVYMIFNSVAMYSMLFRRLGYSVDASPEGKS